MHPVTGDTLKGEIINGFLTGETWKPSHYHHPGGAVKGRGLWHFVESDLTSLR